ncbi:MAG: hypothetical protein KDD02_25410 [Phaeodactylibacter sp.]|nr:hypothetical protein [Phaeodactylibacter sp.]MCB9302402.1 hypothetical protein [Lewinellaceae bacterium]
MAKQVKNPTITGTQQVFQPTRIAAYKGGIIREWYQDESIWENSTNNGDLIGLSFEIDHEDRTTIKARRVYYVEEGDNGELPHFLPDDNQNLKVLPQDTAYYLSNPLDILGTNQANAGELEFYKRVGFVFFTIDQLRPFLEIADETHDITFCGCAIDFGLMAFPKPNTENRRPGKCFSLKVEVNLPLPEEESGKMESEEIPLTSVGQPCPPHWYPFSDAFGQALNHAEHPQEVLDNIGNLYKSWCGVAEKIQQMHT